MNPAIPIFDRGAEFFLVMMMEMRRCNHLLVTTPLDWGATYLMGFMNTMMPHNLCPFNYPFGSNFCLVP